MGDDAWLAAALGPSSGDAQDAQAGDDGWLAFAATHTFLFFVGKLDRHFHFSGRLWFSAPRLINKSVSACLGVDSCALSLFGAGGHTFCARRASCSGCGGRRGSSSARSRIARWARSVAPLPAAGGAGRPLEAPWTHRGCAGGSW